MKNGFLGLEIRRIVRSRRFLIMALMLPTLMYLVQVNMFRGDVAGTSVPYSAYLVGSLASFGAFFVALNVGTRVAIERSSGWQRQLRLTPLAASTYMIAKVTTAMIAALPAIIAVALVGAFVEGVRLPADGWLQLIGGVWVGTLPFALLGLLIGQIATAESVGGFVSAAHMTLGLIGGALLPAAAFPEWLGYISKLVPSHWLAVVGHGPVLPDSNVLLAAVILVGWTVLLASLVVLRYRKDSARS